MFAEASAVLGCRVDVTTVCKNYVKLGSLHRDDYEKIATKFVDLKKKMLRRIKDHMTDPVNAFFMNHYKNVSIFKNLSQKAARESSFYCILKRYRE